MLKGAPLHGGAGVGGVGPSGDLVPRDNSPFALFVLTEEGCVALGSASRFPETATPIRGFLLTVSFGLKSWGLSEVPAPLEK